MMLALILISVKIVHDAYVLFMVHEEDDAVHV